MKSYSSNVMINVKSILRLGFLLGSIFLLSSQDLKATHIVGGDLTYRCLGNNIYEIRLTVRRDCFNGAPGAQFDDPASIGIYDMTTNMLLTDLIGYPDGQLLIDFNDDDTLNQILISDCSVVSGDVCVHTTIYVKTIFLPYRPTGYTLAYQRCCRNVTLNNVQDPLNTGMTLAAELSGLAQLECNSSPQFGAYPPIYICGNKEISFDHRAFDIENDSLVYSLCTPYAGADHPHPKPQPPPEPPYDLVNWRPPYSLANLLGGDPLTIDPQTGALSGNPSTIGQFVVGICVTAYKRGTGVMTGTTRRDFQYNVRMCRDVPVANFSAPSLNCESLTVNFNNQSILADDYKWIFDFGNPGSDTSTVFNPTYTYPNGGFYQVALIVSDSDKFCFDTIIHQVGAFDSQLNADFSYDVSSCTDGVELDITDLSFDPGGDPICSWQWLLTYPGGLIPSPQQNPHFSLEIDGPSTVFVALVVTSCNGCSSTQTVSFPVREIALQFNPESDSICNFESTHILIGGDFDLHYIWSPTLGLDTVPNWDPLAHPNISTCYNVTVTDGLCEVTGQTCVDVQQLPILGFSYETDCKTPTAHFTNSSSNAVLYLWDFGAGNTSIENNPTFTFPGPGIYTVTLSSRDGCDVSITHQVTVDAITEELDEATINCFQPTVALNPDNNGNYLYVWSNGSTLANPIVTVINDTTFYVTISSPGRPDCQIVDSIRVIIPDDFTITAPDDITNCRFDDVTLIAQTNGTNLDLFWTYCNDNNPLGSNPLIVSPDTTTCYRITATDSLGCSKSDNVVVSKPDSTFFVGAPNDTAYCDIQIITLTATSLSGVTFEWFNANPDLIGTEPSVDVAPGTPACFTVIGTDSLGCQNKDSVCLTPTFFDLSISGDESICLDEQVTLCVTNNIPEQDLMYSWTPIESIVSGAGTSCATVRPSETTTYTVVVKNNDLGCKDTLSSNVVVNLFDPLIIVITSDAPNDSIVLSEDVQLFVNQDPNFGYSWTSSGGDNVASVWNPVVVPTVSGDVTYTVTVVNAHGCIGTASITIRVANPPCNDEDIFLPTAFTPNGDGYNDVLYVRSNFISTLELHIYNRWGQEVFKTNDQNIGWDGLFKGERLAPDVFGYYMNITCPNERTFFKKGNITLLE